MRYLVRFSDGTAREINADWTQERDGFVFFMQQTPTDVGSVWPKSEAGTGGTEIEAIPTSAVLSIERPTLKAP